MQADLLVGSAAYLFEQHCLKVCTGRARLWPIGTVAAGSKELTTERLLISGRHLTGCLPGNGPFSLSLASQEIDSWVKWFRVELILLVTMLEAVVTVRVPLELALGPVVASARETSQVLKGLLLL